MRDSHRPYWWMLLGAVAFACMGVMINILGKLCDWQVIACVRCIISILISTSLAKAAGVQLVFLRPRALWMRSLAGSTSLVCCFFAMTHLPIADALTLTQMFPIWVALLSWPMLGKAPPVSIWLAILCGCLGIALIQQPHFQERNFACVIALIASFSTAIAMLGLNRLGRIDPRAVVAHFSMVSLVFSVISYFTYERTYSLSDALVLRTTFLLLGVGMFATAGQIFLTKAFATGAAGPVSVVGLSQVPMALAFEYFYFGRSLSGMTLLGIVLVLAPTAWLLVSRSKRSAESER